MSDNIGVSTGFDACALSRPHVKSACKITVQLRERILTCWRDSAHASNPVETVSSVVRGYTRTGVKQ